MHAEQRPGELHLGHDYLQLHRNFGWQHLRYLSVQHLRRGRDVHRHGWCHGRWHVHGPKHWYHVHLRSDHEHLYLHYMRRGADMYPRRAQRRHLYRAEHWHDLYLRPDHQHLYLFDLLGRFGVYGDDHRWRHGRWQYLLCQRHALHVYGYCDGQYRRHVRLPVVSWAERLGPTSIVR